jgi:hypothetical protein
MASIKDGLRRAANYGRKAAEKVAQRQITVTIRVLTYSGVYGMSGVTLSSTTDVVLKPNPKVVKTSDGLSSVFGGGVASDAVGNLTADSYRIGPITPSFGGGGYSASDLVPTGATNKRVLVLLEGTEFGSGELYQVDSAEFAKPQSVFLNVSRTKQ